MIYNSFSVVVPIYNCSSCIRNCIKSIVEQEYSNVEVILVDDGSTDNSYEVSKSIALEYNWIKVFHKKNEGQLSARIYGIACATKEWVLFLDADDEFKLGTLNTLNNAINSHNDLDCVIFGAERFDGEKIVYTWTIGETRKFDATTKNDFYRLVLCDNTYNPMWRKCIRKCVIPDEDLTKFFYIRMGEDLIQSIGIYGKINSIIIISDVLYRYYVNPLSMTSNNIRLGYQKNRSPLASFKYLVDFINSETWASNADYEKLQALGQNYLSYEVYKISVFQRSLSKKIKLLKEVYDIEVCRKFIMRDSNKQLISGWRQMVYNLFKKKHFRMAIVLSKIIYALKKI